jgi:hypothetical protein
VTDTAPASLPSDSVTPATPPPTSAAGPAVNTPTPAEERGLLLLVVRLLFLVLLVSVSMLTIAGRADATPLIPSPYMSARAGGDFLLKIETMQPIGAFKLRGALNAVAALPEDTPGVTCCSTGNHGRGVAYAARARGMRAVICMSDLVPQAKIDGLRALGAEVRITGRSQDDALAESQRLVAAELSGGVSKRDRRLRNTVRPHHDLLLQLRSLHRHRSARWKRPRRPERRRPS